MHITLISGSHRPTGNSGRIARAIANQIEADGHATSLVDLAETELPFWDEAFWGNAELQPKWDKTWAPIAEVLKQTDAAIIISPEYHGMVPSKLQNFLLLAAESGKPLAHKPALIVSVSMGINGAYPVAELRANAAKNNRILWLPEHLIIRNASHMLVENPPAEHAKFNAELSERLTATLGLLYQYAAALKPVQKSAREFIGKYPNGM
ncbi:MAG: NADPH-dependent oxidoreductase [Proteobacteria bacterium]|nr:NADPH-dependent oxidoreductase [Pseudomonadota bacterium]